MARTQMRIESLSGIARVGLSLCPERLAPSEWTYCFGLPGRAVACHATARHSPSFFRNVPVLR